MRRQYLDPRQRVGVLIAGATAIISGISVFVNSYGVHHFHSPAVYTTAKNLVAAIILFGGVIVVGHTRFAQKSHVQLTETRNPRSSTGLWRLAGFGYVGVIGGGLAFVLFFNGLARTAGAPAAFLHDTLVLFVALLAWPVLRERLSAFNLAAIGLLVGGEVAISGGIGRFGVGDGPILVLAATILWAIETVVAKRLLAGTSASRVALVRMGLGSVVLLAYLAITGQVGTLAQLDRAEFGWALLTGVLLSAYVATWFVALARARAIDVTSVLVGSVVVTSLLEYVAGQALPAPALFGIAMILVGIIAVILIRPQRAET